MVCDLTNKKCEPCHGGIPPMEQNEIDENLKNILGWEQQDNKIHKQFTFKDFNHLMEFVNNMAALAEEEGHHPDFNVSWNLLDITIWTHKINGLSINDFILAAKIEKLPR